MNKRLLIDDLIRVSGKSRHTVLSMCKREWIGVEGRGTVIARQDENKALDMVTKHLM